MATDDNAASGGLLVILGIIVALGAVYFFAHTGRTSDTTVHADINVPSASNPATPPSSNRAANQ